MKNKALFSPTLFFEGMRQLKLIGVLFAVLLALQIILSTAMPAISYLTDPYYNEQLQTAEPVNGFELAPLLIVSFVVTAPCMALSLFRFLNQRASSDFYHSVSHTRVCLFISFLCSIAAWLILFAVEAIALSYLMCAIFSKFYVILNAAFLWYVLATLVAALAVAAGVALAMSLSGTLFTNLTTSALILFLPRLILLCVVLGLTESFPMLVANELSPILNGGINLITGCVFGAFDSFFYLGTVPSPHEVLTDPSAILYTFILFLVYASLGALAFARRKSETAQHSASSGKMQAMWRILITLSYFFVVLASLFPSLVSDEAEFPLVILAVLFGIILYYVYELITTKSFKKMFQSSAGLGLVALGSVVFVAGLFGLRTYELSYTPKAEDVTSVTVLADEENDSLYCSFADYVKLYAPEVKLTEPQLIEVITENLNEQSILLREEGIFAYNSTFNTYDYGYTDKYGNEAPSYTALDLRLNGAFSSRVRRIFFDQKDMEKILLAMENDAAYNDAWRTLPKPLDQVELVGNFFSNDNNTPYDASAIYESLAEELKDAPFAKWYSLSQQYSCEFWLSYRIAEGEGAGKTVQVPIYAESTPKTMKLAYQAEYELLQNCKKEALELLQKYRSASKDEQRDWYLYADMSNDELMEYYSSDSDDAIEYLLNHMLDRPRTDEDTSYAKANITIDTGKFNVDPSTTSWQGISLSFCLDEDFDVTELSKID